MFSRASTYLRRNEGLYGFAVREREIEVKLLVLEVEVSGEPFGSTV